MNLQMFCRGRKNIPNSGQIKSKISSNLHDYVYMQLLWLWIPLPFMPLLFLLQLIRDCRNCFGFTFHSCAKIRVTFPATVGHFNIHSSVSNTVATFVMVKFLTVIGLNSHPHYDLLLFRTTLPVSTIHLRRQIKLSFNDDSYDKRIWPSPPILVTDKKKRYLARKTGS